MFSDQVLEELLQQKNILMGGYNRWLKKDDSNYNEMKTHVEDEIENLTAENAKTGKLSSENRMAENLPWKEGYVNGEQRDTSAPCR